MSRFIGKGGIRKDSLVLKFVCSFFGNFLVPLLGEPVPACPDISGIYREGLGAVLIKVEWEIKICPKPLLRPDLSGKGLKSAEMNIIFCPKPLKGLKECMQSDLQLFRVSGI